MTIENKTGLTESAFDKAIKELEENVETACEQAEWAYGEIKRLRAENMELQLRNDNLLYMIRSLSHGRNVQ